MKTNLAGTACGFGLALVASIANAALIDRGGGLIYDTDLNITWLGDANLATTNTFGVSGIGADGNMSWGTAQSWIGAMNAANYLGYHDWRLPTTSPINGTSINSNFSYNGSTDFGYNLSAPGSTYSGSKGSEMAYLFFNELGNKSYCFSSSPADSCTGPQPGWGLVNKGPFSNLQIYGYWSGTELAQNNMAWYFWFNYGYQSYNYKINNQRVMAVRPGDISSVPVPTAAWLLGSGLLGLIGVAKRKSFAC